MKWAGTAEREGLVSIRTNGFSLDDTNFFFEFSC